MNKLVKGFLILISVFTLSIRCEKEEYPLDSNENNKIIEHTLVIMCNSDSIAKYVYADSKILSKKIFADSNIEETEYKYNLLMEMTGLSTFNVSKNTITNMDFNYNEQGLISSIACVRIFPGGDSLSETQILEYDSQDRLIKINAFLPETFEYSDLNITKHVKVNTDIVIWMDYSYTYDSKANPLNKIGLPLISVASISKYNINSVIAEWIEYPDCEMTPDTNIVPIHHTDSIYTSCFEYNKLDLPITEYRNFGDKIDTIRYIYE